MTLAAPRNDGRVPVGETGEFWVGSRDSTMMSFPTTIAGRVRRNRMRLKSPDRENNVFANKVSPPGSWYPLKVSRRKMLLGSHSHDSLPRKITCLLDVERRASDQPLPSAFVYLNVRRTGCQLQYQRSQVRGHFWLLCSASRNTACDVHGMLNLQGKTI